MPLVALPQVVCLALLAVLLVGAAVQDLRTMQIANGFSLAIVGLFAASSIAGLLLDRLPLSSVAMAAASAAVVFAVGTAAFAVGVFGGGDVKLLAAVSLFAGADRVFDFLTITALVGGALGLAILSGVPVGQAAGTDGATVRARLRRRLPYGPAIAAGGLWVAAASVRLS